MTPDVLTVTAVYPPGTHPETATVEMGVDGLSVPERIQLLEQILATLARPTRPQRTEIR